MTTTASAQARFEGLATDVLDPLRRFLARRTDAATADDVLSEVLLVLWRRLDEVPTGAGALPWTYAVAHRALANARRSRSRQLRLVERAASLEDRSPAPGPDAWVEERDPALAAALAALGDIDRDVVRLWAWEQLTPAEIAPILDLTANAVSIRLHRAKQKMMDELQKPRKTDGAAGQEARERRNR